MDDKVTKKQLAFYTTEDKDSVLDAISAGKLDSIRLAVIEQKKGELIENHGASFINVITRITDVETGDTYKHSFLRNEREASFILLKDFDARAHKEIGYMYTSSDYYKEMIRDSERKMKNLTEGIKPLNDVVEMYLDEIDDGIDPSIKMSDSQYTQKM